MNPTFVRQCSVSEIQNAPNINALMEEYAAESHVSELPTPNAQWGHYTALENMGAFASIGSFADKQLIGFIGIISNKLPHHGATIAIVESFFVSANHRKSGLGLKLLKAAEQHAKDVGSPCLLVNAPHGGSLEKVMPRMGYRHTGTVFCRGFS